MLQYPNVIVSQCHSVTVSPIHYVIVWQRESVTKAYLNAEYETPDKVENVVVYFLAGGWDYESDEVAGAQ